MSTRPLVDAPSVRTTPPPAQPITDPTDERARNWWPSRCERCDTGTVWFPSTVDRLHFDLEHTHGGAD